MPGTGALISAKRAFLRNFIWGMFMRTMRALRRAVRIAYVASVQFAWHAFTDASHTTRGGYKRSSSLPTTFLRPLI